MQLKLNNQQAAALLGLITDLLDKYPGGNKAEKLLDSLVNKVRIKIRNRLDSNEPKKGYSFTLPIEEALAFDLWMEQMRSSIPPNLYLYEENLATQITNQIDMTYA